MKQRIFLAFLITLVVSNPLALFCRTVGAQVSNIRLTVMTYNIGVEGPPIPTETEIAAVIANAGQPDVLLIQDAPWRIKFTHLVDLLGYRYLYNGRTLTPRTNGAIVSKYPLEDRDVLYFYSHNSRPSALGAMIAFHGKRIFLASVHFDTLRDFLKPRTDKCFRRSWFQLLWDEYFSESCHQESADKLLKWIGLKTYNYALIGGDFNSPLLSKPIRRISHAYKDSLWPSWNFFSGTKRIRSSFLPNPRIDYLFHSLHLSCVEARVINHTAGDHYPIYGIFQMP